MLEIISKADMLYGKIMKTQNWRLLRYLDSILLGLYKPHTPIRYSRFNLSWPMINRIRWDGKKIKLLSKIISKNLHISVSTFTTFVFDIMLFCMKNNNLDFELDEEFDDIIEKPNADEAPSDLAVDGLGCVSKKMPSAPAAIPALAIVSIN